MAQAVDSLGIIHSNASLHIKTPTAVRNAVGVNLRAKTTKVEILNQVSTRELEPGSSIYHRNDSMRWDRYPTNMRRLEYNFKCCMPQ